MRPRAHAERGLAAIAVVLDGLCRPSTRTVQYTRSENTSTQMALLARALVSLLCQKAVGQWKEVVWMASGDVITIPWWRIEYSA